MPVKWFRLAALQTVALILSTLYAPPANAAGANDPPDRPGNIDPAVAAVLDQYAATQKALVRCEQVTDVRLVIYFRDTENVYVHIRQRGEYRRDRDRAVVAYADKRTDPYKPMPEALPPLPPPSTPERIDLSLDSVSFTAATPDGLNTYTYYRENPGGSSVLLDLVEDDAERLQLLPEDRTGCWMRGWVFDDRRRIDDVLRAAGAAARARPDAVDGVNCTLVEADTSGGKYAVWFDPARGGAIVRARVERGPHDLTRYGRIWERTRRGDELPEKVPYSPEDDKARETLEWTDVRLEQVEGSWLPVAMTLRGVLVGRDGTPRRTESHIASRWDLSPEFGADDFTVGIREGAKVQLRAGNHWAAPPLEWRSGKVVPARDDFTGSRAGEQRTVGGVALCWCPSGKFVMGSPPAEPERRPGEDQVEVTLSRGFWAGKYEVTQAQWKRVVGEFPGDLTAGRGDDFPVYAINFAEAEAFCRKLTETARVAGELPPGWAFRLPTEAQWEYACRAGTTTATAFGDRLSSRQANFQGKPYNGAEAGPSLKRAAPVGSYPANAWGLHDAHGNVFEWCRDWHHAKLPGGTDPDLHDAEATALLNRTGDKSRVRRGGCWADEGWPCRSAFRVRFEPHRRSDHIGFRVVVVSE